MGRSPRLAMLGALALVVAAGHLAMTRRWGFFFPFPLLGSQTTIWLLLAANSVAQSIVLVFGLAHVFGLERGVRAAPPGLPSTTLVFLMLLGLVFLSWVPGFVLWIERR